MCSATATPWIEDPACSLGPSQHLESSEPDWEGLSHRCLWLGEERRKLFGPDQPEDPEEGEAVPRRPPPLKSSFLSTGPEGKWGAPSSGAQPRA